MMSIRVQEEVRLNVMVVVRQVILKGIVGQRGGEMHHILLLII